MRPETVHLMATLVRHGRGAINALEKWERTIPREDRAREMATIVDFARTACVAVEDSLRVVKIG